ncbi:MAG TPA: DsrE/DsrF/DrsH-like family protein [Nitrospiria bacterium]|nr:DsrE/DsrF/DrsH-like family protein [Nitrospiria bacterium]
MGLTSQEVDQVVAAKVKELAEHRLEELVREQVKAALEAEARKTKPKRVAIVASKGTLDAAYPPLILATTAAALDMEAGIFFTFFGLQIVKKSGLENLKFVPVANPAMPMPMPNLLGALPGMTGLATLMMKQTIKQKHIASIPELMGLAKECGVKLWPCQMTMGMMDIKREELIDGLQEPVGAATFLEFASNSDITLFV